MSATPRFDELRIDAHAIGGRLNAPFNYIVSTELLSDLGGANRLALVGKCGGSGDDKKVVDLGELGCEIFGDAVRQMLMTRRASQIHEGQNNDGRSVLFRGGSVVECCFFDSWRAGVAPPPTAHSPLDIL